MAQNLELRCFFGPSTLLGAGAKTHLEPRIKKFRHIVFVFAGTSRTRSSRRKVILFITFLLVQVLYPAFAGTRSSSLSCILFFFPRYTFKFCSPTRSSLQSGLAISNSYIAPLCFKMACKQNLDLRCVLAPAPKFWSQHLGCWGQNTSPYAQGCDLS